MSLTEIAIKRPSIIVVIFSVLSFLGMLSYVSLSYELLPKFSVPTFAITTVYPSASPAEVENGVTKKIEEAVSSMQFISAIKSQSMESYSSVVVELKQEANIELALQDAQRKIDAIADLMPRNAKKSIIVKFSIDDLPVIQATVEAEMPPTELFDVVKQKIKPNLARVQGVADIALMGGEEREVKVNIDNSKLETYRLSLLQISQAINNAGVEFPAGKVRDEGAQTQVRLAAKFKKISDLENIVIGQNENGSVILLKEVAEIQDSKKEIEIISRLNGKNAIGIAIKKQSDANAVKMSALVKKEFEELEKNYADKKLKFVVANDASEFTVQAADAVIHDLALAIALVAVIMLLFLHSLRNALIVMVSIPASIVSTFIAMYVFGFTLNLMTLLALSLVVGILVDDSIVVLENIYRHLEMGKKPREAALDGRNEIGFTALSITLVDVVVFLPIAMVSGLVSDLLRQFSIVVVVSTLMSLFVSFTITPLLASRFAKLEHPNSKTLTGRFTAWFEKQIHSLTSVYTSLLSWSLKNKIITLTVTLVLFFGSFELVNQGFIGSEFATAGEQGQLIMRLELPSNATLAATNRLTRQAEEIVMQKPEVKSIYTTVGNTSNDVGNVGSSYKSEFYIKLIPKEQRNISTQFFTKALKMELEEKIAGVKFTSGVVGLVGTEASPIQIVIGGTNIDSVFTFAEKALAKVKAIGGTMEAKLSVSGNTPELSIDINKEKLALLGLNMETIGTTLQVAFTGDKTSKFSGTEFDYDVNIRLDAFDRKNRQDLENLTFVNADGRIIKLSQFASIRETIAKNKLERKDRITAVTIESQVIGRTEGAVGEDIRTTLNAMPRPKEVSISYEGNMKQQADAFGSMGFALIASILFVYLIMVALYDSYIYPFVVLFSIPVAVVGALLALALTMQSLNIFSMLGMIMLVGLVAKNAILLVDFTNQMKAEGMQTVDALIEAGKTRLRPILMTTVAMVIGMFPIALASGAGAEWKNGLAWALIGGLSSSMLLTLVVVPVMYLIVDKAIGFVNHLRWGKKKLEVVQN